MKKLILLIIILLTGSVSAVSTEWLSQNQEYNFGHRVVEVIGVDVQGTTCGVAVDGVLKWISEGDSEEFGVITVKVLEALPVNAENKDLDTCNLIIWQSKSEIVLIKKNASEMENDNEKEGITEENKPEVKHDETEEIVEHETLTEPEWIGEQIDEPKVEELSNTPTEKVQEGPFSSFFNFIKRILGL